MNTVTGATGTVGLSATDSYTGATSLAAGILNVTGNLAGTSAVNIAGGTTLNVIGSIASGGTVTASPASSVSVTGTISGGVVNINGSALSLSGLITNNATVNINTASMFQATRHGLRHRHRQHQHGQHVQRLRHELRRHRERHRDKHREHLRHDLRKHRERPRNAATTLSGSAVGIVNATSGTLTLAATGPTDAASTVNVGATGTLNGTGAILGNASVAGNGVISLSGTTISGSLLVNGGSWLSSATVLGGVAVNSGLFTVSAPLLSPLGLEVYGGTTSLNASIPGALYVNGSGAMVIIGPGVTVASADFSAGTGVVNATNPLSIANGLRLAERQEHRQSHGHLDHRQRLEHLVLDGGSVARRSLAARSASPPPPPPAPSTRSATTSSTPPAMASAPRTPTPTPSISAPRWVPEPPSRRRSTASSFSATSLRRCPDR